MNHEERLALIMKPFPSITRHATRPWYGVNLSESNLDLHVMLNGLVPSRSVPDV